jgi:PiT family inorganic phosphate transporter
VGDIGFGKSALDKDLKKVVHLENATGSIARSIAPSGIGAAFLFAILALITVTVADGPQAIFVVMAAVVGGYMALNIGANDVANNMGPAVGANALTMGGALAIAAVCEAAGALLAGGDVVTTISRDIIRADAFDNHQTFILAMLASLLAGAMWIHLATYLGAPVSTTHSVVGGVLGAGIAASGLDVVSWPTMSTIVASWVISPVLGGVGAALLLALIRKLILQSSDRVQAARTWVPVLVALMSGIFAMYLATKGLSRVWKPSNGVVLALGAGFFVGTWLLARPWVRKRSDPLHSKRKDLNRLFLLPLIISAALLSFAHGANDVANAVGPLAAIVSAANSGSVSMDNLSIPTWVMAIGAIGISLGLALFGPRVIRTVGTRITKLDPMRAFCAALAAAGTVLVASALGLPVSSTHIAVGGVFGVGLIREYWRNNRIPSRAVQAASPFVEVPSLNETPLKAVKKYEKRQRRRLVRRQHLLSIGAAWIITVPATAAVSALIYLGLNSAIAP